MSFGLIEVVFLFALGAFWLAPIAILITMADSKGRSKHFAWWAVGLGWLGFIIAAILIAGGGDRKPPVEGR